MIFWSTSMLGKIKTQHSFIFITILAFCFLISCQQKTEVNTNYENPNSEIIPLLLSTESFDENWTITKIFNTQSNKPFALEGLENLEEISVIAFWTYYGNDTENNILVEHTLYRFEYLPEIPNSIIDKEYYYLGENEYGIKRFTKCELTSDSTKSNRCTFVFVKHSLISTLAILADNQINSNAIEFIKKIATPLLEDIEKKIILWEE